MTCREMFYKQHAMMTNEDASMMLCERCPDEFGYLEEPEYCIGTNIYGDCTNCWGREIPEETEKEKPMTNTKKTKAELLNEIAELQKQVEGLEKYKQYQDCADELKALHTSFMNAGFSDEQAFSMMKTIFQQAVMSNLACDISKAVVKRR